MKNFTVVTMFFEFENGRAVSVTVADGKYVKEIEVTFYCRGRGRKYSDHTIPYTADSHKRIMNHILACGGRLGTW